MESTEQMNDPPATSLTHKYLHHSISLTHTILFLGSKFITPPLRWIVVLHSWEGFQWEDQCKKLVPDMIELLRYAMKDHEESILFRSLFPIFLLFSFSFYHQPVCITRERLEQFAGWTAGLIRFLVFWVVLDLERFCGLTGPLPWPVPGSTVRSGPGFKTLIQRERERERWTSCVVGRNPRRGSYSTVRWDEHRALKYFCLCYFSCAFMAPNLLGCQESQKPFFDVIFCIFEVGT